MALSQDQQKRLSELTAAAEASRSALTSRGANIQSAFDIGAKFENSVRTNPTVWISLAASAGWILSRLPVRKKKIYVAGPGASKETVKAAANAGKTVNKSLLLAGLGLAFQLSKPALQRFVTEQITELAHKMRKK